MRDIKGEKLQWEIIQEGIITIMIIIKSMFLIITTLVRSLINKVKKTNNN